MFYIVATPIGNLKDITFRAIETLKNVDYVLAEDTRVAMKLLSHYKIETPCISFHQHSDDKKRNQIFQKLEEGKSLALISDAGTPTISDPGARLVFSLREKMPNLKIVSIPGPSAITTALSMSGFKADKFVFFGFPPKKRKRKKFFEQVSQAEFTAVLYESPHRILKTLEDLKDFDAIREKDICLCREMTKIYETVYCGKIFEVLKSLKSDTIKGEFTIVISS